MNDKLQDALWEMIGPKVMAELRKVRQEYRDLVQAESSGDPDRLMTPKAVAELLHVSEATLASWRCNARCEIPFTKVGRKVLYRRRDVVEWVAGRRWLHTGNPAGEEES